uniref:SLC26A/SulP transporter domain-containing protein n=1 Tax=Periophthalmus magnuspinnatus TaxID=409849 RepID=A0A3B4A979_9GOBI
MHQEQHRYVIDRAVYSLTEFDREFDKKSRQFPIEEKVKKFFRLCGLLFRLFPILSWLPRYKVRENLLCDVISGVSAGTIQVPQGMAFALLANLPPVNGLYSSFFPLIPYFFMGTAHQLVPGTFAVLSIMVGIVCSDLAPESDFTYFNETLNRTEVDKDLMNEVRLGVSGTLIGLGFLQFGFVAIYLSESFVRGFMTAAGLQILISVLKYVFGIKVPPYSGPLAVVYVILMPSLSISGPLDLPKVYNMSAVGEIALGFPAPVLPTVSQWSDMLSTAFSLAIVGYVINLAMGRTLAAKHGYDVDPNQVNYRPTSETVFIFKVSTYRKELNLCLYKKAVGSLPENVSQWTFTFLDFFYCISFSFQFVWVVSFLSAFFLSLPYGVAVGVSASILVVIFKTQL